MYSFALFALLCTCYPSLQCAENVQKCAEPKSALQDDLKLNGFPAGFLGHRQSKNSQFHPDNNLTSYTGFMAGFRTSEQTPFDIEMRFTMNKLLSCRFNMDTNRVEARFEDGTIVAPSTASPWRTSTATPQRSGLNWTGCCTTSPWSMCRWCWKGRWSAISPSAATTVGWKIKPL